MTEPALTAIGPHGVYARAVAGNLRSAVTNAGVSQRALSRVTGIPRTTLRRKLTTGAGLTVNDVARVCSVTGADLVAAFMDPAWEVPARAKAAR